MYERNNSQSRLSLGADTRVSPFAPQKKNHEQAMKELSVIAKDLENYNKNRLFNERARSMMMPENGQSINESHISELENQIHSQSQM